MRRFPHPRWITAWLLLSLTACAVRAPAPPPDIVIDNAQVGGSIVAFDRDSTRLAFGDWRGSIGVRGLAGGDAVYRWRAHAGTVNGLVFLDGGRRILSAGYDGELAEWDAQGRRLRHVRTGSPVMALAVGEADGIAVTGHADGSVGVWDLDGLRPRRREAVHGGAVHAVAYLPGRRYIASSGSDARVFLWRGPDAPPALLRDPPTASRALQFSPDGRWLIGSGWFRLFRWDLADASLATLPTEHHGLIASIHYSPDGRYVASISRKTDSSVYFLDPADGAVLRRFRRHDLCGAAVAVSPDRRWLATTSDDASVRLWRLEAPAR
ncbi:MAG: hypothetical protein LOY58_13815 [Gammaproteobacteria bacterium]|nr:hypothetical protein [Gammaproteobacteria bacterium]